MEENHMSATQQLWHGIPREQIPWLPALDAEACIGCQLCFVTCGRGVYEMDGRVARVANGMACMVGCSTCAAVCPTQAISFPERDLVWRVEREHKIFREVKREAADKQVKLDAAKGRAAAEARVAAHPTRARLEIAGVFGHKAFVAKLEQLLDGRPFDVVKLKLELPTLQGIAEKTPGLMSFEVTSTDQEDVTAFLEELRQLVRDSELVLVNETRL
jgi:Fe-S-cluster-containing hydrogenase component 2